MVEVIVICITLLLGLLIVFGNLSSKWEAVQSEPAAVVGETVVINTFDQRTTRGVVFKSTRRYVELSEALQFGEGGAQTKMMGRARIPDVNIAFLQVIQDADNDT